MPVLFLVELGAAINVASTTVPVLSIKPLAIKVALIVASNRMVKSSLRVRLVTSSNPLVARLIFLLLFDVFHTGIVVRVLHRFPNHQIP